MRFALRLIFKGISYSKMLIMLHATISLCRVLRDIFLSKAKMQEKKEKASNKHKKWFDILVPLLNTIKELYYYPNSLPPDQSHDVRSDFCEIQCLASEVKRNGRREPMREVALRILNLLCFIGSKIEFVSSI